jgi:hypothetical protein
MLLYRYPAPDTFLVHPSPPPYTPPKNTYPATQNPPQPEGPQKALRTTLSTAKYKKKKKKKKKKTCPPRNRAHTKAYKHSPQSQQKQECSRKTKETAACNHKTSRQVTSSANFSCVHVWLHVFLHLSQFNNIRQILCNNLPQRTPRLQ